MLALSAIGMGGLAGCKADTGQSKTSESRKPAASSGAYEDSREITSEEKKVEEEKRRTEIASQYSVYETYGMSYDYEKDRFVYNGQVVRNWFLSYYIHTIGRI